MEPLNAVGSSSDPAEPKKEDCPFGGICYDKSTKGAEALTKARPKILLFAGVTGGVAVGLVAVCLPFVSPALRKVCLPYVPATKQQIDNVLQALKGRSGRLLDIGSGDGRIVLAAAKNGFVSEGVELNYWLVLYSRFSALRAGLSKSAVIHRRDLWKFDLKPYDNVVIFGVNEMMADLTKKFEEELTDSHVVACRFPLPGKKPQKVIGSGIDRVWLYHFRK